VGKYDKVRERTGWGVPTQADRSRSADEIDELIALTHHSDAKVRTVAVTNLCPCHVRADFAVAWDRILQMTTDPSPKVRRAVVHMLADGSPRHRADQVVAALETLRNDEDRVVRRHVNRVLASYRRTGRINVL
jgi:nucleotide-binding universal stress UspA family protein